jgi:hypothetical protein
MCRGDKRQYGQSQRELLLVILLEREQEDVDVLLEIQLIVGMSGIEKILSRGPIHRLL